MTTMTTVANGSDPLLPGGHIRILTVSLIAVAAVAAGIYLTTRAQRQGHIGRDKLVPAGEESPARFQLDKLRTAGL